jgi:hypothetical protein
MTMARPPETVALDPDDYSAKHVGRLPDGRQFFLTTPFDSGAHEFVALYLFDAEGQLVEALIDDMGPRTDIDWDVRDELVARRLRELGEHELTRIRVAPFKVEKFGLEFGFILQESEDDDDNDDLHVIVEPGNYMAFYPPFDSGDYDT